MAARPSRVRTNPPDFTKVRGNRLLLSMERRMIATTKNSEQLSSFVRSALRRLTATSTITIEHAITSAGGETVLDRIDVGRDGLRALDKALRSRTMGAARPEAYLPAPLVARMLGIKTATLAKWRRHGKGPQNSFHTGETTVVYPASEVETFLRAWKKQANPGCA